MKKNQNLPSGTFGETYRTVSSDNFADLCRTAANSFEYIVRAFFLNPEKLQIIYANIRV